MRSLLIKFLLTAGSVIAPATADATLMKGTYIGTIVPEIDSNVNTLAGSKVKFSVLFDLETPGAPDLGSYSYFNRTVEAGEWADFGAIFSFSLPSIYLSEGYVNSISFADKTFSVNGNLSNYWESGSRGWVQQIDASQVGIGSFSLFTSKYQLREDFSATGPINYLDEWTYSWASFDVGGYRGYATLDSLTFSPAAAVPEPGTWAMMVLGLSAIGMALRQSRAQSKAGAFA